jgi:GTPase
VDDSGFIRGIPSTELEDTVKVLEEMCRETSSDIKSVEKIEIKNGLWAAEVKIEKVMSKANTEFNFQRRSVAFLGPSQIGKSTLIATLCSHTLDNPPGRNRLRLLRHRHEIISGRTSGVSIDYLVYDKDGNAIRMDDEFGGVGNEVLWAPNVLQMVDLPGDPKYVKTVYAYLTQRALDAVVIYDHLEDSSPFEKMLKALGIPFFRINRKDVDCCTGKGLEAIKQRLFNDFFTACHFFTACNTKREDTCKVHFIVEHVHDGPEIGLVISGLVTKGSISCGEALFLMDQPVQIRSIHRMRQPIGVACCGQTVAITLQNASVDANSILKGSVLSDCPINATKREYTVDDCSVSGEGLVFMQGNRMTGSIKGNQLALHTALPPLPAQKYIYVRDDKISFGLAHQ